MNTPQTNELPQRRCEDRHPLHLADIDPKALRRWRAHMQRCAPEIEAERKRRATDAGA